MFDFVKNKNRFLMFSGIILAIGLVVALFTGIDLDIEFTGGAYASYNYEGEVSIDDVETYIEEALDREVTVQSSTDVTSGRDSFIITFSNDDGITAENSQLMTETLNENFDDNDVQLIQSVSVEPSMGSEFLMKCLFAVAFAMVVMVIFVAWRFKNIGGWSAGAMAVVALFHDTLMVLVCFIVLQIPLDSNFVAVVLTILGYSLNDTIVIYDRIRENKRLYGTRITIDELVNKSINQSLSRSINTTITTVVAMLVVTIVALAFNVDSIISFSLPMVVGMLSGTYSTICIAGPLWVSWQKKSYIRRSTAK